MEATFSPAVLPPVPGGGPILASAPLDASAWGPPGQAPATEGFDKILAFALAGRETPAAAAPQLAAAAPHMPGGEVAGAGPLIHAAAPADAPVVDAAPTPKPAGTAPAWDLRPDASPQRGDSPPEPRPAWAMAVEAEAPPGALAHDEAMPGPSPVTTSPHPDERPAADIAAPTELLFARGPAWPPSIATAAAAAPVGHPAPAPAEADPVLAGRAVPRPTAPLAATAFHADPAATPPRADIAATPPRADIAATPPRADIAATPAPYTADASGPGLPAAPGLAAAPAPAAMLPEPRRAEALPPLAVALASLPDAPALGTPAAGAQAANAAVAPSAPPPPPPARQVAQLAVALAFAPGMGSFRLALEPGELGRVDITVRREGEVHRVQVMAERPETLALLQRDRAELDRALAQSGLRVEEGGIGFSLATGQGGGGASGQERRDATPARALPGRAPEPMPPEPRRAARGLLDLNI